MSSEVLSPRAAMKRYMARMLGSSAGYIGSVIGAAFLIDSGDPVTPFTFVAAVIPGLFILLMLSAVWRYLSDVDEVARHDLVSSMMISLFGVLAISGGWGLIELFHEGLPRLPIFWVFPIFFLLFGLVTAIYYRRCV